MNDNVRRTKEFQHDTLGKNGYRGQYTRFYSVKIFFQSHLSKKDIESVNTILKEIYTDVVSKDR